jgi:two-component system, NarL family, invasion response regulator UvrY
VWRIASPTRSPSGGGGGRAASGTAVPVVGVLAVDDDPVYRRVVARIVAATPGFDCVGEAASGEDATTLAPELQPELVLMDVRMPGIGGIEAARRIIEQGGGRVAVVLMSSDPRLLAPETLPAGTAGTLVKERLSPRALRALWGG